MRTDDGTSYCLPTISSSSPTKPSEDETSITLDLQGLPMIHDDGVQTGLGARGWYNSAVFSAMMLLEGNNKLQDDLQIAKNKKSLNVLELGAGAIGLVGMTVSWILSQRRDHEQEEKSKIFLTDNDPEVLAQLGSNVQSVLKSLDDYHHFQDDHDDNTACEERKTTDPSTYTSSSIPEIHTRILDWDEHDLPQDVLVENNIDLVFGAELAYSLNNCCALQVAKILSLNPNAVVWIVQFPRKGWFQVFQMQLKGANSLIQIEKFSPTDIHDQVHTLAQSIMPTPYLCGNLGEIKALRITLKQTEKVPRKSFCLAEQIERSERLSQQLNADQQESLKSHWDADRVD